MYRRVLLVDDEPALLLALQLFLEDAGHEVQTAEDVQTAMVAMQSGRPDAIVCDLRLPDVDGFEFYRRIQQNHDWKTIPFILLTGAVEELGPRRGASLGISRYLSKPFDPEDLLAALRREPLVERGS